jgi:hypothetical protein
MGNELQMQTMPPLTGLGIRLGLVFYKYFAPTALGGGAPSRITHQFCFASLRQESPESFQPDRISLTTIAGLENSTRAMTIKCAA